MASGPKRVPDRNEVPPSQGIPNTAAWAPSSDVTCGSRAKVRGPVKRGAASASHGWGITRVPSSPSWTPRIQAHPGGGGNGAFVRNGGRRLGRWPNGSGGAALVDCADELDRLA